MDFNQAFTRLPLHPLFDSLLPDFVLAFAFFTALTYAVFGRRFPRPRPAIAMSASTGLALAIGLTWWLHQRGLSARNLGPVAVGFFIIMLAMVLFQALKQMGGTWSGAAMALGASLFVAALLDSTFLLDPGLASALALLLLIVGGVLFFLHHHHGRETWPPPPEAAKATIKGDQQQAARSWGFDPAAAFPRREEIRRDASDVHVDRLVGRRLEAGLHQTRNQTDDLQTHPEHATVVISQLRAMLPAEGWLTERLARLRAHAHHVREGHLADLEQTRSLCRRLPREVRRVMAAQLVAGYHKIVGIETRIDRLDAAVAEIERRVRQLTAEAETALQQHRYNYAQRLLKEAEKTQHHADRLLRRIEHTEQNLLALVTRIAGKMKEAASV